MKNNRVVIGILAVLAIGSVLRFVPVYIVSVDGCKDKDATVHRSLIAGSSKSSIAKEANDFVVASSAYDCPTSTVSYKLFVL